MYKKVLFFVFEVLTCFLSVAQTSVTVRQPHMYNPAQKTIIKEYRLDYPSTIACYNSDDSVAFVYSKANMQAKEVAVKGLKVNDFIIEGDTVYFCGSTVKGSEGIYGFFDIQDVFNNNGNISVMLQLKAGDGHLPVKELTRITSFPLENNTYHIACIGSCNDNHSYPCLLDFEAGVSNPSYLGGYVFDSKEFFTDVKVVQNMQAKNYLVTAGFDTSHGRYISIRVYDPDDIFSTSGLQNIKHVYCIDTGAARPWYDGGVLLTDITGGEFVTLSYRESPQQRDTNQFAAKDNVNIHIGLFSLNQIINNSLYAMQDNFEIPLGWTGRHVMNEIVYSNRSHSIVFLHSYNTQYDILSDFCEFKPGDLQNAGTLHAYQNPGTEMQGLSLYHNMNNYILSGFRTSFPTELRYEMETLGISSKCVERKQYHYERVVRVNSMNVQKPFNSQGFVTGSTHPTLERIELPLYINCEEE